MMRLAVTLLICAVPAAAQPAVGIPAVDSANVARAAWTRAARADDLAVTRREVKRAASAWPTQPSYVWARAVIAARSRDTAGTLAALGAYADLGLGRDLSASPDLDFARGLAAYKNL